MAKAIIIDEEFNQIIQVQVRSQIASAFLSLAYKAGTLDAEKRKSLFRKKAKQIKTDIASFTDSLVDLMTSEEFDEKMTANFLQDG